MATNGAKRLGNAAGSTSSSGSIVQKSAGTTGTATGSPPPSPSYKPKPKK